MYFIREKDKGKLKKVEKPMTIMLSDDDAIILLGF